MRKQRATYVVDLTAWLILHNSMPTKCDQDGRCTRLFVAILVAFNLFDLLPAPAKSGWVADINVTKRQSFLNR